MIARLKIDNNSFLSRFEASVNGRLAVLDYRIEQNTILLLFVKVPEEEQGRGIASRLTQEALRFARDKRLTVLPHCDFISTYVRNHPEELR